MSGYRPKPSGRPSPLTSRLVGRISFRPKFDIVDVWRDVVNGLCTNDSTISMPIAEADLERLALTYECKVNPVWPMPHLLDCLAALEQQQMLLGIISNAQRMTSQLFPALVDQTLEELGFRSELQFFSYRFGESKPGAKMYEAASLALARHGIEPQETVYIGNDMLNDVWGAAQAGFRTILFAGDERSLRLRADDKRMQNCQPDAVVTELASIPDCL